MLQTMLIEQLFFFRNHKHIGKFVISAGNYKRKDMLSAVYSFSVAVLHKIGFNEKSGSFSLLHLCYKGMRSLMVYESSFAGIQRQYRELFIRNEAGRIMIRVIVAFLASVLTGVQGLFIVIGKEGICLNEGCEIIDSFPKLPPLYFNIAGFIFFLTLFWCFLKGRRGSEYWHQFAKLLLLAGLAAEAVLLFYQYSIVTAFCSYCLVIFSLIFLLNILCGMRQLFTAVTVFIAVFGMLSTLELRGVPSLTMSLDEGSYARTDEQGEGAELYLFFSETCEHCENVISSIREQNRCDIRFNPVEKIESFEFPGSTRFSGYDPKVNVRFLKSLDIKEIPVLVIREEGRIVVLKGESRIMQYTQDACVGGAQTLYNQTSEATGPGLGFLPSSGQLEQGCSVDSSCEGIN